MLSKLNGLLKKKSIDYWLDQGTLLGLTREDDFIEWDWDIDLAAKFESTEQIYDLVKFLRSHGFYAKYIQQSQSVRLEPKDKYFGWRHIDIHFQQHQDTAYRTFFYEFAPTTWLQSLLVWLVVKFDWVERNLGGSMPSRRQVYFDESLNRNMNKAATPNLIQTFIARSAYKIKNVFYDLRLSLYGKFVPVVTADSWFMRFDTISLAGENYHVPANQEEYLCFRYGENWREPNKDYDWHDDGAVKNNGS